MYYYDLLGRKVDTKQKKTETKASEMDYWERSCRKMDKIPNYAIERRIMCVNKDILEHIEKKK